MEKIAKDERDTNTALAYLDEDDKRGKKSTG